MKRWNFINCKSKESQREREMLAKCKHPFLDQWVGCVNVLNVHKKVCIKSEHWKKMRDYQKWTHQSIISLRIRILIWNVENESESKMYFKDLNSQGMIGAQTSDWLKSIGLKCFPGVKRKPEYFSLPTVECDCKSFSHFKPQHDAWGSRWISQNSYVVHWSMQHLMIEDFNEMFSVDCQNWKNNIIVFDSKKQNNTHFL